MTLRDGELVLLITDLAGSTPIVASLEPERFAVVLDRVLAAVDSAVVEAGGEVVFAEGDGVMAVLPSVAAAVAAAVDAQRRLLDDPPPFGVVARLRTPVHVGPARRRAIGGVVGLGVHQAARVGAAAGAGQLVLSATASAAWSADEADLSVVDLGPHHVRDFDAPVHLHLVQHVDLPPATESSVSILMMMPCLAPPSESK